MIRQIDLNNYRNMSDTNQTQNMETDPEETKASSTSIEDL
jgi:hypothetical protein